MCFPVTIVVFACFQLICFAFAL